MWPLPALGCLCLLALLGMFAAQQHRESELRLLTAQQELAQQQARIQDLQRQLRQCKTRRRPSSSLALSLASAASVSAPSNLSLSAGLEHVSEATLAAAELVQTEMHAGLAAESPGWCVCPPPPNYTRVCSALHPPVADEAAAAAREAERQRGEAERLRGMVAREKLRLLRSEELLALARAELAAGAPHEGARGGGKRRGNAVGAGVTAEYLTHGDLAKLHSHSGRLRVERMTDLRQHLLLFCINLVHLIQHEHVSTLDLLNE